MYILSGERDDDEIGAFKRYRKYLMSAGDRFPKGAFELATSGWWYDFKNHKCPHDAWLRSVSIHEDATGDREENRRVRIKTTLLGAYHDLILVVEYVGVCRYSLEGDDLSRSGGHYDWRFDEFRLSDDGNVIHEIECSSISEQGRWIIECEDVRYSSHPYSR